VKGMLERALTIGALWLVANGYLPEALKGDFVNFAILLVSLLWGYQVNKPEALAKAADKVA
jgi:hypothetical protein